MRSKQKENKTKNCSSSTTENTSDCGRKTTRTKSCAGGKRCK